MRKSSCIILVFITLFSLNLTAQSLEDLLDEEIQDDQSIKTEATFKSTQLINGHTTKSAAPQELIFTISHRFGHINSGFSDLFGLDLATVRFGFQYGVNDWLALGIGRSTFNRNYDLYFKSAILKQSTGKQSMPINLMLIGTSNASSSKWPNDGRNYLFAHRLNYSLQALVSRKMNANFSLQFMPTFVHKNLVRTNADANNQYALGVGGRYKITNWVAITGEYFHNFNLETDRTNPLSLGVDLETGGHVFQLFFTNTAAIYDTGFITETSDKWMDGNIRFGFNISRTF